jgi:hypothetical protein
VVFIAGFIVATAGRSTVALPLEGRR